MKQKNFQTKLFHCGKSATIFPEDRLFIQSMKIDRKASIARVDRKTAKKLKKETEKMLKIRQEKKKIKMKC